MAYRYNGAECDTYEELQRLMGAARTTSAAVKETRNMGRCPVHGHDTKSCCLHWRRLKKEAKS